MTPPSQPHPHPQPFRLLDLPPEIRLKIYRHHLVIHQTIDLHPFNARSLLPRLLLLQTSKQVFEESHGIFYGANVFRVFPTHGDFFRGPHTVLSLLSARCRAAITCLELRIGPGWAAVPRSWTVRPRMGFPDLISVRTIVVFVECDPSHDVFRGFRRGRDFFTLWAAGLLRKVLANLPALQNARFEAYPSVARQGDLMSRLVAEAHTAQKTVLWGPTFEDRVRAEGHRVDRLQDRVKG